MSVAAVLVGVRGLHVAAVLSLTGAAVLRAWLRGTEAGPAAGRACRATAIASAAAALASGALLLLVQSAALADTSIGAAVPEMGDVLFGTVFGRALLVRGLLVVAVLLAWRIPVLAACLALLAAGAQAWMSHAAAGDALTQGVAALHVMAACTWLGALVPLLLVLRAAPAPVAQAAALRFSGLGKAVVLILAVTAAWQGRGLIGGIPGLIGSEYGLLALVKLVLFSVLLGIAGLNARVLTPRAGQGARGLMASIVVETAVGLAVIWLAAALSQAEPGAHVQPDWPLSWQPSTEALNDPDLGPLAWRAAGGFAVAALMVLLAVLWRRVRWVALAVGVGAFALAWPQRDLLTVGAYPTSFYSSPSGFSAASIMAGERLYRENCVTCHGATGHGDGPAAQGARIPPADLTAAHVLDHADGELFWWLTHGIEDPEGGMAMPAFPGLSADDRWALIDFVRARASGAAMAAGGGVLEVPLPAPALSAVCPDGQVVGSETWLGRVWRVMVRDAPNAGLAGSPAPSCMDASPEVRQAYTILAGGELTAGWRFLVDASGYLRAIARPGDPLNEALADHPAAVDAGAGGHHHH